MFLVSLDQKPPRLYPNSARMLDPQAAVRRASADAMVKIDKKIGDLAGAIVLGESLDAASRGGVLGRKAAGLSPLVMYLANRHAFAEDGPRVQRHLLAPKPGPAGVNPIGVCISTFC